MYVDQSSVGNLDSALQQAGNLRFIRGWYHVAPFPLKHSAKIGALFRTYKRFN